MPDTLLPTEDDSQLRETQLRSTLDLVQEKSPDVVAESRKLGKQLEMEDSVIEENIPQARQEAETRDFVHQKNPLAYPKTYEWLTADPRNMAVAQDDMNGVAAVERALNPPVETEEERLANTRTNSLVSDFLKGYYNSRTNEEIGAAGQIWQDRKRIEERALAAEAGDLKIGNDPRASKMLETLAKRSFKASQDNAVDTLAKFDEHLRRARGFQEEGAKHPGNYALQTIMQDEDWFTLLTTPSLIPSLIAESGYEMGKGIIMMALTRGAGFGIGTTAAVGGIMEGSAEYTAEFANALTEAGVDLHDRSSLEKAFDDDELMAEAKEQAGRKAAVVGGVGAIGGVVAGKFLPFTSKMGNAAMQGLVVQPVSEGLGEGLSQVAKRGELSDFSFTEVLAETLAAGPFGVLETAVQTKGQFQVAKIQRDVQKAVEAEDSAEQLTQLGQKVRESKLFGRSKDLMADFIESAAETGNVLVDAKGLAEYTDTLEPEAKTQLFTDLGIADNDAGAQVGDFDVGLGALVNQVDGEHFDALVQVTRKDPDAMTVAEAKVVLEQQEDLQKAADDLVAAGDLKEQYVQEAEEFAEEISAQLKTAGLSDEQADASVRLQRNFALVMAKATGLSPKEVLGKLTVERKAAKDPIANLATQEDEGFTQQVKDGREFRSFFSSVVNGLAGVSDTGVEYETVIKDRNDLIDFSLEYAQHRGNFDDHIAYSIPGFKEVQMAVGNAIATTYGPDAVMLDVGASEGSLAKAITSRGGPTTVSLDPNPDMANAFATRSQVPGAKYAMAAFSDQATEGRFLWDEKGTPIVGFKPDQKFDVIHEAMTFQFIENDRPGQISRVKEMLTEDGVAIFEEKLHNKNWEANEAKKDAQKSKYFHPKDMNEKAKAVLEGMNENMASDTDFEAVLGDNFKYVSQFWDAGNFKGYIASDNMAKLQRLHEAIGDTTSEFSAPALQSPGRESPRYPVATDTSDGRTIREEIPNQDSISSSLDEYEIDSSIRDVPMSEFEGLGRSHSVSENKRIRALAEEIKESNEIAPLIVVIDKEGPYILEGGHRADALAVLKAKSFPAMVVRDLDPETGTPTLPESDFTIDQFKDEFHSTTLRMVKGVATTVQRENGDVYTVVQDEAGDFHFVESGKLITSFAQSVTLRNRTETLKKYGLNPWESHKTRDVAAALEQRQRDKFGPTEIGDYSEGAEKRIARWMVEEVKFEMQHPDRSGVGWYGAKWQEALNTFAEKFPELAEDREARSMFTLLVALTSDGQKVFTNFRFASELYAGFRDTGKLDAATFKGGGTANSAMKEHLKAINFMLESAGSIDAMVQVLLEEKSVKELNAQAKDMGINFATGFGADATMPFAALILGPKLGSFFANLSGAEGFLTMDRWWSRTFNRYRGNLLAEPTPGSLTTWRNDLSDMGIDVFQMSNQELMETAIPFEEAYRKRNYKNGSDVEKHANNIVKGAFQELNDTPQNASDRDFMVRAAKRAVKSLKRSNFNTSLADVQAILWYYEKRLYGELGAKDSADVSYLDAAQHFVRGIEDPPGTTYMTTPDGQEIAIPVNKQTRGINLEVAPNPQDVNLARTFDAMTPKAKLAITREVFEDHLRPLLARMGINDPRVQYTSGGYGDTVSPSILIRIPNATFDELSEIGAILGEVTSQEAIVAFDESQSGEGATRHVQIKPKKRLKPADQKDLYDALREKVPGIGGFDWRNSSMIIGDFAGLGPQFVDDIQAALEEIGGDFAMVTKSFKSQLVEVADASHPKRSKIRRKALRGQRVEGLELDAVKSDIKGKVRQQLGFTSFNQAPRVTEVPASLSTDTAGILRVDKDGLVPLTHWGAAGLNTLDPAFHGGGFAGTEQARDNRTPRLYFGLPGYAAEPGVMSTGQNRYFARVQPASVYDYNADPDGIMSRLDPALRGASRFTAYENAIHNAGYRGYWAQTNNGPVAALFDKVEGVEPLPFKSKHNRPGTPRGLAGYTPDGSALEDLSLNQPAFHGSPVTDINQFSTDFLGTGEGAQAFGWGLYFTNRREVAEFYREALSDTGQVEGWTVGDTTIPFDDDLGMNEMRALIEAASKGSVSAAITSLGSFIDTTSANASIEYLKQFDPKAKVNQVTKSGGKIYEVELNVEAPELIHLDKPLDAQHPEVLAKLADTDLQWFQVDDGVRAQRFATREEASVYADSVQALPPTPISPATGKELYGLLSQRMGGDRQASLWLNRKGVRGLQYEVDGGRDSETPWSVPAEASPAVKDALLQVNRHNATRLRKQRIESPATLQLWVAQNMPAALEEVTDLLVSEKLVTEDGDVNFVIFDGADVKIKPLPQGKDEVANRAVIDFERQQGMLNAQISLFAAADLSSFLHESAHFFLETMRTHANSSPEVKKMLDTAMSWMGVEYDHQITSDHHELFARTFEAYLREGKAPNKELKRVFTVFREWLMRIYATIQELTQDGALPIKLTPDITELFNKMLTIDLAVEATEFSLNQAPLFNNAQEAQMTQSEFAKYIQKYTAAKNTSREKLDAQVVKNEAEKITEQYQLEIDAEAENQAQALGEERPYKAMATLRVNRDLKLDRAQLVEQFGAETAALIPGGRHGLTRQYAPDDPGADLDQTAEILGYTSAQEMVDELTTTTPLADLAREQATVVVNQKHAGALSTPAGIQAAAEQAAMNATKADVLFLELKALDQLSGGVSMPRQVLKSAAERIVDGMTYAEMTPAKYMSATVRYARAADKAVRAKDYEAAAEAKRQQVLNHQLFMKTRDGRRSVDNLRRFFKKFTRPGVRKNIAQDYVDQIDNILDRFDFTQSTRQERERRQSLATFVSEKMAAGEEVLVPADLIEKARQTSYKDMNLGALRELSDSVKNLEHLGRLKEKLFKQADARQFAELKEDILVSLEDNNKMNPVIQDRRDNLWAKVTGKIKQGYGSLLNFEFIFHRLDGDKQGVMYDNFWQPISAAQDQAADMKIDLVKDLRALKAKAGLEVSFLKEKIANPMGEKVNIPEIGESLTLERRLAVALNWGNETSRQRVLGGNLSNTATPWTETQVEAIFDTLTKEQWQFVQDIWDLLDKKLWPQVKAHEKDLTGVAPEKVVNLSIKTKFGTLTGGYYPLKYDGDVDTNAMKYAEKATVQEMFGGNWARAGTRKGHVETRLEQLDKPIRTDLGVLTEHLDQVVLDLTHRKPIMDVVKLLGDNDIGTAIKATAGLDVFKEINPWLQWVAGSYKSQPNRTMFESIMRHMRIGASVVGIGFRLSTALINFTGIFPALTEIRNPAAIVKHAYATAAHPKKTWAFVAERSLMMKHRQKTFDREVSEQLRGRSMLPFWYFLIAKVDQSVSLPAWMAAYEQELQRNDNNEAGAIKYADFVIRTTMSSGRPADLTGVQRSNELLKLMTVFYSYFAMIFNRFDKSFRKLPTSRKFEVIGDMAALWILPALLGELLAGRGPDEEDEESWAEWAIENTASYGVATIPIVRDVVNPAITGFDYQFTPADQGMEATADLIKLMGDEDRDFWDFTKPIITAAGYAAHLPTGQLKKILDEVKGATEDGYDFNAWYALMGRPRGER